MFSNKSKNKVLHTVIPAHRVARGLGWVSLGLGLIEMVAPVAITRFLGVRTGDTKSALVRGYGAREIAAGLAILGASNPASGVWARVAGDGLDLGALALGALKSKRRNNILIAIAAVAGVTAIDLVCASKLSRKRSPQVGLSLEEYRRRSGFPSGIEEMRGAAIGDEIKLSEYAKMSDLRTQHVTH